MGSRASRWNTRTWLEFVYVQVGWRDRPSPRRGTACCPCDRPARPEQPRVRGRPRSGRCGVRRQPDRDARLARALSARPRVAIRLGAELRHRRQGEHRRLHRRPQPGRRRCRRRTGPRLPAIHGLSRQRVAAVITAAAVWSRVGGTSGFVRPASAGRADHGSVADHPERRRSPFTQLEMRGMWTYSDGAVTVKGYWRPGGTARAGSWVLVDQATGNVQGMVAAGEFSRRFRPVDVFADVPGLPGYLGTVTAPDGTALVDLVLDRNPFMLANGPRRVARPHALVVPRRHRDGWSSATASELAARHTAMTLIAAWYRSLDGGHVVFGANDSAPNLDYLRDMEAATGIPAASGPEAAITKNPRQDVQHAHLHAFYAEPGRTENHEAS